MKYKAQVLTSAFVLALISNSSHAQGLSYQLITRGLDAVSFEIGLTELEAGDVNGDGKIDLVTIGDHGSPMSMPPKPVSWFSKIVATEPDLAANSFGCCNGISGPFRRLILPTASLDIESKLPLPPKKSAQLFPLPLAVRCSWDR